MTRRKRPDRPALSELLGKSAELAEITRPETTLPITELKSGVAQPRREFNQDKLKDLSASIRENGILQPILVRPAGDSYEIVAGERRWRAAELAGLNEVPVIIRTLSDYEARQLALIENLQRENLNTVDEVDAKLELVANVLNLDKTQARARLMQLLREESGDDHARLDGLFASFGESWASFAKNKLRILNWPASVLEAVREGLAFTLAAIIVRAPEEHHSRLIEMAKSGTERQTLQDEVLRLSEKPKSTDSLRMAKIGRVLSSSRWTEGLSKADKTQVCMWLEGMPDVLKKELKE